VKSLLRACVAFAFAASAIACTRAGESGPVGTANAWTQHGLLRIVDLQEPDSLNPIVGSFQIDNDLSDMWGGKFFEWSDKNAFVPDLVTVAPTLANGGISKDGLTYVYHLRPGVLWQDGPKFTAADVVFTWHAIMNKKNNVPSTVGFDDIASIDVRDPLTIAVHLKKPFAPFVSTFFGPSGEPYPVLPKHLLAKYDNINQVAYNSAPVGTGPFIVERWQRGSKIVLKANPHFWRGPPKLKEIWYTPIPDENTVITQLKSHAADLDYDLSSTAYAEAQNIPGYAPHLTPFTQYGQLMLNVRSPVLADVAVRRALWYATDIKRLIATVTHGVQVQGYTDQPSFSWAYNPNVAHYPFDLAKARALLDGAGWHVGPDGIRVKKGRRLSLTIAGVTGSAIGNAMNVQVQNQWRAAGIEVDIKVYTSSLFFASFGAGGIVNAGKFDVAFYSWVAGVDPDDSTLWMCDQIPPNGQNASRYCNPKVDALERIALASSDRAVRKKAYDGIQALLAADVPTIIAWYDRRVSIVNTDVKGWAPASAVSSFWNSYDWST
jgi:peptide/nickel transport system substrate-binding protein